MGTASTTVTSGGPNWPGGDPTGNANAAASVFYAGNTIRADHFNYVINAVNQMNSHTHNWTDNYQLATFGNNGDRNNYSQTSTSNGPNGVANVGGVSAGTVIQASHHNSARDSVGYLTAHSHYENDRTS